MLKDYLRLHFIVFLWGFTAILGKLISLPPVELVFFRTLIASVGLAVLLNLRQQPMRIPGRQALRLLGVGVLVAVHWITFFLAARLSSVSVCLAGMATLALWTSVLEPVLLRKKFQFYEMGLGLLTLVGLYIVAQAVYGSATGSAAGANEHSQLLGLAVAVLSAGLGALFSVLNVKLIQEHPPLRLTFYEMAGACLVIVVYLVARPAFGGPLPQLDPKPLDWVWLLVLAGVCTVYAFSASVELMKRLSAFALNLTINLEPVYGIALAVLMFWLGVKGFDAERLSLGFYLGTLVILLSVLIHPLLDQWQQRRRKASADEAVEMVER
ncbi:DMT family transporter [Hymenobacter busanensis]|uniref:DMT family transporter n=1 Tax=Hymenobacter busanensis TaxID=2607656 RepID=A0A7L4ZZ85_9BACT|nr:DMT family transporter [Hymenobacter busanensis]KAA9332200.1 DMT family transporter [Hymenobacter busanensis]QHJ07462.1 EamA family transporter [Hymenobacter busanensis]